MLERGEDHHTLLIHSWGQVMEHDGEFQTASFLLSLHVLSCTSSRLRHHHGIFPTNSSSFLRSLFTFSRLLPVGTDDGAVNPPHLRVLSTRLSSTSVSGTDPESALLKGHRLEVNGAPLLVCDHWFLAGKWK